MLPILIPCVYFALAVVISRPIYGHMRASSIDSNRRSYPSLYCNAVEAWNRDDRSLVLIISFLVSLVWPLTAVAWAVMRYMERTSVLSSAELEDIKREQEQAVIRLERSIRALEAENEQLRRWQEST